MCNFETGTGIGVISAAGSPESLHDSGTGPGTSWARPILGRLEAHGSVFCRRVTRAASCPLFGHKKARVDGGPVSCNTLFLLQKFGGYGWTRTTDPSIMSAVL